MHGAKPEHGFSQHRGAFQNVIQPARGVSEAHWQFEYLRAECLSINTTYTPKKSEEEKPRSRERGFELGNVIAIRET